MFGHTKNLFYDPAYLEIQKHNQLRVFQDEKFRTAFSVTNGLATSLDRGLFGSVENFGSGNKAAFENFIKSITDQLRQQHVLQLALIHPPKIYAGFVPLDWLEDTGFRKQFVDINHHIELSNFQMHSMEKRKLEKLNQLGVVVSELDVGHLREVYDFLVTCRHEKKMELNISLEQLSSLFQAFPVRYSIFGAYLEGELVSVSVNVQTGKNVVYYYLPGTLEKYKSESPMVAIIEKLVDHFQFKVKYFDLGISSIQGKPQEGLIAFKEKMGGIRSDKCTYRINL